MRTLALTALAALLLCVVQTAEAQDPAAAEEAAAAAAGEWIALVDTAGYASSWEAAAPVFQSGISQDQWMQAVQQVRSQVGGIDSRTLHDSQYRTTLPNAPEGEYVVLQYQSSFEQLPQAMEMVVMTKTEDDEWRAAGYQVVPAQQQPGQQPPQQPDQQQDQ